MSVDELVGSEFGERAAAQLAEIEAALSSWASADTPFVDEAAHHIIAAGGKRFRPMLVVATAGLYPDSDPAAVEKAAVAVELTHVASLYHDDVMDEADYRRGAESANHRWRNNVAILVGDFLFARASGVVAELGAGYVQVHAETFARLVQGQIAETRGPQPGDDPVAHYLQVIADKTGSLIAASAKYGGMVGGAPASDLEALSAFGEELGVVFQLSDDVIDLAGSATGKTPGTDLREGVLTLPTLMLLASDDPADDELKSRLRGPIVDEDVLSDTLSRVLAHRVVDEARAEIARRAEVARGYLTGLPDGEAKDALSALCDSVTTRTA